MSCRWDTVYVNDATINCVYLDQVELKDKTSRVQRFIVAHNSVKEDTYVCRLFTKPL